jgi:hypothetical protein
LAAATDATQAGHDHEGDHQPQLQERLLQADRPAEAGDRDHAAWAGPGSEESRDPRDRQAGLQADVEQARQ